jgi:hypothetical protein
MDTGVEEEFITSCDDLQDNLEAGEEEHMDTQEVESEALVFDE